MPGRGGALFEADEEVLGTWQDGTQRDANGEPAGKRGVKALRNRRKRSTRAQRFQLLGDGAQKGAGDIFSEQIGVFPSEQFSGVGIGGLDGAREIDD